MKVIKFAENLKRMRVAAGMTQAHGADIFVRDKIYVTKFVDRY